VGSEHRDGKKEDLVGDFCSKCIGCSCNGVQGYNRGLRPVLENAPLVCKYTTASGLGHEDGKSPREMNENPAGRKLSEHPVSRYNRQSDESQRYARIKSVGMVRADESGAVMAKASRQRPTRAGSCRYSCGTAGTYFE